MKYPTGAGLAMSLNIICDIGAMLIGRVSVRELILITMLHIYDHGIFIIQNCGVMLFMKIAYHGREAKALMSR